MKIKNIVFICSLLALSAQPLNSTADINQTSNTNLEVINEKEILSAPFYENIVPIYGWNRNTSDCAQTLQQWKRWWQYLRMKKSGIMRWIKNLYITIYPSNEICRSIFVRGIYAPNSISALFSFLNKDSVFLDIGAGMGYVSLLASNFTNGKIIALEPSAREYNRLLENIRINKLESKILPYKIAVSDEDGTGTLSIAPEERSDINVIEIPGIIYNIDKISSETVEVSTIDNIVQKFLIDRIDVMKMDIEGSELKALKGAINTIEKHRPVIMIGINQKILKATKIKTAELEEFMRNMRYVMYTMEEEPEFKFSVIDKIPPKSQMIFCMHESVIPPKLQQPIKKKFSDKVKDFFAK